MSARHFTPEEDKIIRESAAAGLSSRQTAAELLPFGPARNPGAVILHGYLIGARFSGACRAPAPENVNRAAERRRAGQRRRVAREERQRAGAPPATAGRPLEALGPCQCRWPVAGEPLIKGVVAGMDRPAFLFCAAPTAFGQTWCGAHQRLGYLS